MATTAPLPWGRWNEAGRKLRSRAVRTRLLLSRSLRPAVPVFRNLAACPFTVAASACAVVGAFLAYPVAGWFMATAALVYLEHIAADQD